MTTKQLELEFSERLRDALRQAHDLGYNTATIEKMLASRGAVSLAKMLVESGSIQGGMKAISGLGRKDLTIESIMLEPTFKSLFTTSQLQAAAWRLEQV